MAKGCGINRRNMSLSNIASFLRLHKIPQCLSPCLKELFSAHANWVQNVVIKCSLRLASVILQHASNALSASGNQTHRTRPYSYTVRSKANLYPDFERKSNVLTAHTNWTSVAYLTTMASVDDECM